MESASQHLLTSTVVSVIKVQSLQQYIFVKIVLNKYLVERYAKVRAYTFSKDKQYLQPIEIELLLLDEISETIVLIQEQLHSEGVKMMKGEKKSSQSLQKFDQKIFGGTGKYTLLKSNYLNSKVNRNIYNLLFNKDDVFQLQRLFKNRQLPYLQAGFVEGISLKTRQMPWFLIKDKRQQQDNKVYFSSNNLIKLNDWVIINIYKVRNHLIEQGIAFDESQSRSQSIIKWVRKSGLFDTVKTIQAVLQFEYFAYFRAKLTFTDSEQLASFLNRLYSFQMEECLQWNFNFSLKSIINFHELDQLLDCPRFDEEPQRKKSYKKYHSLKFEKSSYDCHNTQSLDYIFQRQEFALLSQKLMSDDILSFRRYWSILESSIRDLIQNWNIKKHGLDNSIRQFIRILEYRINKFQANYLQKPSNGDNSKPQNKKFVLYSYLYPNIQVYLLQLKKRLQKESKLSEKLNQEEKKMNILDKLLYNYFQEIESINNGKGAMTIKVTGYENRSLKDIISDIFIYQNNVAHWEDVFNTVTINLKKVINQHQNMPQIIQQMRNLEANLTFYSFSTPQCLSCMEFFYLKTSILRPENSCIRLVPSASKIKEYEAKIKELICGMLNNNGGVILFNCIKEYSSIYPCGCLTTEKDKQAYQNQILNLLNFIYPKPEISTNIVISFVPIVVHPRKDTTNINRKLVEYTGEDQQLKLNQFYYDHIFVQGLFVLRIKVCPNKADISKVYIWQSEDQIYHLSGFQNHSYLIKIKNIHKAIKAKYKKYEYNKRHQYRSANYLIPSCHICKNPSPGIKITQRLDQQQLIQRPKNLSYEQQFSHVSMIVIRHRYLKFIQEKFTKMKIKCHIQSKFQTYRFKVAQNTAVLYHDLRFEELLRVISFSNQFQFDGKMTLAIYITEYLKLQKSHSERKGIRNQEVATIEMWLKQEFPTQNLKFFEFRKNQYQKEYYLKTGSKLSTLFIYYVVNNYKIKAVFRNPQQLDRMSAQDKQQVFIEIKFRPENKQSQQYLLNKTDANAKIEDP